jgi:GT2 family glycosyltransferase
MDAWPDHSRAPTVSIITPAFNTARYVEDMLESVLAQTFTDFELVLVDDGSTDETAAIAEAYAHRDTRIRLIRQRNRGIAAARNAAIACARGQFLALLDSDDIWFPTYLAEQMAILRKHPDISILSANAINLGGAFDGEPLLTCRGKTRVRNVPLMTLVRAEDSMSILAIFRRELVDTIGGFDVQLNRSEDYDFWLRAATAGFRIAVNARPLGFYRRRPDSVSADEVSMLHAVRAALIKLRQRCADRPEIQKAVDRQLARFTQRAMLATARTALLQGDMAEVAVHFGALADTTGAVRYRVARWLSDRAPLTIWWAYRCKRTLRHLAWARRRHTRPTWISGDGAPRRILRT